MLQPGRPTSSPHAVTTAEWERKRLIAYISGTALVVLSSPTTLLQTLYHDAPLTAVTLDPTTGTIAVSSAAAAHIYAPDNRGEGFLTWVLRSTISLPPPDGAITSLSWSPAAAELLVGSSASLSLWSATAATPDLLWRRALANPCAVAALSPDGTLAASVGCTDRLVKVWRRLSIGSEALQFDYTYLPHPRSVSALHWRRGARDSGAENVLYTVGVDGVLRVWAPVWPHDVYVLQLWAVVDLTCGGAGAGPRFALVLDNGTVALAAEAAVQGVGAAEKDMEVLQRLIEVANRGPEVVIAFDARGRMWAWGVENVGCRTRKTTNVFSILEGAGEVGLEAFLGAGEEPGEEVFVCFQAWADGKGLNVLAHVFDGRLCWFDARLDHLLDLSPRGKRMEVLGVLSGHSKPIETLVRTADGKAMITLTRDNEHVVWTQPRGDYFALNRRSSLEPDMHVHRAVVLDNGKLVMTMHHECVVLWDTRRQRAREVSRLPFSSAGKMLCLLLLPEAKDTRAKLHVVGLTAEMKGIAWEISTTAGSPPSLREFATFELDHDEDLLMILPVDPVGWNATLSPSSTLDTFSREVATTVHASGLLQSLTAKLAPNDTPPTLRWLSTGKISTGIPSPALAKGNSIRKIALVNAARSELTIWDSRAAQLEYTQSFATGDVIRDLDWTSTPDSQSILAVGFPHRVLLMCQLRYDYLSQGPSWASFREIRIRELTPHPIGDSLWLANGGLVIGAGNQLFVYSRTVEEADSAALGLPAHHKGRLNDVFEIVSMLNGPVPVYHPQFLQQCILAGKSALVDEILVALHKALRTWHEEIPLDNLLEIPVERFLERDDTGGGGGGGGKGARNRAAAGGFFDYLAEEEFSSFDEALASSLCALLVKIAIPALTGSEQIMLAGIIECVSQVRQHRRSIDENAARYLLAYKQQSLLLQRGDLSHREVVWAFHSSSQEILTDLVGRGHAASMTWGAARGCGIFMWLRDEAAVRRQMEAVARAAYGATDERNPVHCSLYYLALRKKNVLLGLWRMAAWHREQAGTMRLLANDFGVARWRTAAKKNAYALLGKRRFEYAAAFFLLADSLKDAVNVCLDKLDDPQLAIAIARVYEGDSSPVLHTLLETRILPLAASHGNRWLASWAFWMLRKKDLAVQSLLTPLATLLPTAAPAPAPTPAAHMFTADDPALIILYAQVREQTVQTLRGAARISPAAESAFVLHTARLYDRMGCDLLALDLVRNWVFLRTGGEAVGPLIEIGRAEGRRHRRRSSVTVVDTEVAGKWGVGVGGGMGGGMGGGGGVGGVGMGGRQTEFVEPDMSWAF